MPETNRLQDARDDCRENAGQTVIDRIGLDAFRALGEAESEYLVALECRAQAPLFADQYGVDVVDVLRALYLESE
jgi:hypothetical protein